MADLARFNLGIPEHLLVERVFMALRRLGATNPSKAVSTEKLARRLRRLGIRREVRTIGATIGSKEMLNGCMKPFQKFNGTGGKEPWQQYVWYLPAGRAAALQTWLQRLLSRFRR